jgi:hypothetical protein
MLPRNNNEIFRENGWRPSAGWPTQLAQLAFNVSVPSDGLQGAAEKPLHKWLNGSDHWLGTATKSNGSTVGPGGRTPMRLVLKRTATPKVARGPRRRVRALSRRDQCVVVRSSGSHGSAMMMICSSGCALCRRGRRETPGKDPAGLRDEAPSGSRAKSPKEVGQPITGCLNPSRPAPSCVPDPALDVKAQRSLPAPF